jgi:hypothetical protein
VSEIDDLRTRVATLEQQVAGLLHRTAPIRAPAPAVESAGPTISHPQHSISIALPDAVQRDALAKLVIGRFKFLGPDVSTARWAESNREDWEREFEASLLAIAAFGRGEIDTKVAVQTWIARAETFLCARRVAPATMLTLPPFLAACLAFGVAHTLNPGRYPYEISLGLTIIGTGRAATASSWEAVLRSNRLPDASVQSGTKPTAGPAASVR